MHIILIPHKENKDNNLWANVQMNIRESIEIVFHIEESDLKGNLSNNIISAITYINNYIKHNIIARRISLFYDFSNHTPTVVDPFIRTISKINDSVLLNAVSVTFNNCIITQEQFEVLSKVKLYFAQLKDSVFTTQSVDFLCVRYTFNSCHLQSLIFASSVYVSIHDSEGDVYVSHFESITMQVSCNSHITVWSYLPFTDSKFTQHMHYKSQYRTFTVLNTTPTTKSMLTNLIHILNIFYNLDTIAKSNHLYSCTLPDDILYCKPTKIQIDDKSEVMTISLLTSDYVTFSNTNCGNKHTFQFLDNYHLCNSLDATYLPCSSQLFQALYNQIEIPNIKCHDVSLLTYSES